MLTRGVTSHHGNYLNDNIHVGAIGEPGPGGAIIQYEVAPLVSMELTEEQKARLGIEKRMVPHASTITIKFQDGNPADGINGVSNEALLAVLMDRTLGFQNGPGRCAENAEVLEHLTAAMNIWKRRTARRVAEGTEGTTIPDKYQDVT